MANPLFLAAFLALSPAVAQDTVSVPVVVRGGMPWPEAVKQAAEDLHKMKGKVAFSYNTKFNPEYWTPTSGPARYKLTERGLASPHEAVLDILRDRAEAAYSIECATALKFILYLAMIKHVGSARFNAEARKTPLEIGAKEYESILDKVMKRGFNRDKSYSVFPGLASDRCLPYVEYTNKSEDRDDACFLKQIQAGDGVYIVNLNTDSTAYQGENTVYLGGEEAFGWPFGKTTIAGLKIGLKAHWVRNSMMSQISGIPNGPPGFVHDFYRADPAALAALGQ